MVASSHFIGLILVIIMVYIPIGLGVYYGLKRLVKVLKARIKKSW